MRLVRVRVPSLVLDDYRTLHRGRADDAREGEVTYVVLGSERAPARTTPV